MENIKAIINKAIKENDLNDAVYSIQVSIGIEDGFNASIFFYGYEDEQWENAEPWNRANKLTDYIMYELANMNFENL